MTQTEPNWHGLADVEELEVPAKPASGLWTLMLDYVSGPRIIRIAANGRWKPVEILECCSPDGYAHWIFARDQLLLRKAPVGALIGKIGGSIASTDDGDIFLVGSYMVIAVDKQAGPLYLTVNDAPGFFDGNRGALTVRIRAD